MEVRKLILATVLGLAVMMFLSGLWHGLAMKDFYATHSPTLREVPLLRIIGLGYLLLGVLMAVIYPKGYEVGSPWLEGVRFGMFMGLLFALPRGLVLYGSEGCHTGLVVVDAAWHLVEQGRGPAVSPSPSCTAATALTTALTDLGVSTQTSDDNLVTI